MSLKSFSSVERSQNLVNQITFSFLIKGLLFLISYAQFPAFNNFLNKEEFGLWMTLISFYNWFILFDFGIGHGLKNILSEQLSYDDHSELKKYSTSAIIGTLLIGFIFIILFEFTKFYIGDFFQTSLNIGIIKTCVNFTFYSCLLLFLHNTLSAYMYGIQKGNYTNYLNFFVNLFLLAIVLVFNFYDFKNSFSNSLIFLSQINFSLYLIFFIIICFIFFSKHKIFIPDFKIISWKHLRIIIDTGLKFFFIQISVLFIFPIDSFILSHFTSTTTTGDYNVLIKIFTLLTVAAAIINQSSWPSITEAYYKKDYHWLNKLFKKLILVNVILIALTVILSIFLNEVLELWMGRNYHFSNQTILLATVLHIFFLVALSLSTILYSINFLKSQIVIGIVLIIIKSLLIYFLVIKKGMGLEGVLISSMVCFIVFALLNSFICIKKIRNVWKPN